MRSVSSMRPTACAPAGSMDQPIPLPDDVATNNLAAIPGDMRNVDGGDMTPPKKESHMRFLYTIALTILALAAFAQPALAARNWG